MPMDFGILDTNAPAKIGSAFQEGMMQRQNMLAQQAAMKDAEQNRQLNALRLQKAQQDVTDEQAMRDIWAQSGGDLSQVHKNALARGLYQQAGQISAQMAAQREAQIKQAKEGLELIKTHATGVMANPTLDNAIAALNNVGRVTGQDMSGEIAQVQALGNNPQAIKQWAAGHALQADKMLPQFEKFDLGGQTLAYQRDPITGQMMPVAGFQKSMTPGEIAADARARAQLAQSERHFQATQGLEREKMATAGKQQQQNVQRVQDAQDALNIIGEAESILNQGKATQSYGGRLRDVAAQSVGISTEGAQQSAQLKALSGALVSKMPKMSGPQSDKDVALYREMAGQIGDETLPIATRKAALKTVRKLQEQYAGQSSSSQSAGSHPADIQNLLDKYK